MVLDARGRPVRRDVLTREVAAPQLTGVRNVWQQGVAGGLTPAKLAGILEAAAQGDAGQYLTLAEEMEEREPHYHAVLGTRKRAASGLDIHVEAATDEARDVELADAVRELVRAPEVPDLLEDLLDALGKGYSAVEILWDRSASQWRPSAYVWRDPHFFCFDRVGGRELRLLDDANTFDGVPLPPYKFLVHTPRLKTGITIRGGLARLAAVTYMCKSYDLADWLAFAEVFGMPLRLGRYGPGATEDDLAVLRSAVANLGIDAAAVLPESMRIDFEGGDTSRGGDQLFLHLADWLDKQTSKAVLGQTMTTDSGSSYSQAKVHDGVRMDILRADTRRLAATLNRDLVRPFIELNWGPQARYPRISFQLEEATDVQALASALAQLVPLGLRVEQSVVRDKLGMPDPADDAEVLSPPGAGGPAPAMDTAANRQAPARAASAEAPDDDELDELTREALSDWEPLVTPSLDPVRRLVAEAGSYEEVLEGLPALLEEMDGDELVRRLAEAAFMARGLGAG